MIPDFQRLRIFLEVTRQGSMSAAARSLSYTPPAISQQIALLEREIGTLLFVRGPRGVRLTDAGIVLVGHAQAALDRLLAAESEVRSLVGLETGTLRIATFPTAGATLLPEAIATFRDAHPGVGITMTELEPEDSIPRLRVGDLDLALVYTYDIAPIAFQGVTLTALLDDPLYLLIPVDHRLAAGPPVRMADLVGESWIQGRYQQVQHVLRLVCQGAGFEPTIAFESDDYQVVMGLVAARVGVALAPGLALAARRSDVAIRPLHTEVRRAVLVATPAGYRSGPADALLRILLERSKSVYQHLSLDEES